MFFPNPVGQGVDQAYQLALFARARYQAYEDGGEEANAPGPDCRPKILRHLTRIVMDDRAQPPAVQTCLRARGKGESLVERRAGRAQHQPAKSAVPGRPPPEHSKQESCEQR